VLRTPLVRFDERIWLKLENLQPTNAYKIRGASNAVAKLSEEDRAKGVWTISAGNAGQGVAYAARQFGVPSTVVAIETAPQTKLDRMRALGATIVPVSYERAWVAAETHEFEGLQGTFVHPFDNHDFIAGHGTMGLEILEDLPDVRTVIAAIGGGGLITGVGSAIKTRRPDVNVLGAEPETAAPYAYSLAEGGPRRFPDWQASFVDGAGGKSVTERMWQRMRAVTDGSITVTLDQVRDAMRLIAEKSRTIAEGAGALSVAAALTGEAGDGPIVCVISGGNIDLSKFAELVG
jgi:threonine dehydratase